MPYGLHGGKAFCGSNSPLPRVSSRTERGICFCFFHPPAPTCPACPEPLGDPVGSLEGAAQRARRAPPVGARHAVPGATASSASLVAAPARGQGPSLSQSFVGAHPYSQRNRGNAAPSFFAHVAAADRGGPLFSA